MKWFKASSYILYVSFSLYALARVFTSVIGERGIPIGMLEILIFVGLLSITVIDHVFFRSGSIVMHFCLVITGALALRITQWLTAELQNADIPLTEVFLFWATFVAICIAALLRAIGLVRPIWRLLSR